jgi:glycosyltransferase involved in cell wall biosynthesis
MNILANELSVKYLKLKDRLLFIGPINLGNSPKGGDEFKNQLAVLQLQRFYCLKLIDTVGWKKNPFLIFNVLFSLAPNQSYKKIIISASTLSALRLIKIANKLVVRKTKIVYWVIGGELDRVLLERPELVPILNGLKAIVVQTHKLNVNLGEIGLTNTVKISNFKDFNIRNLGKRQKQETRNPLKLVFLSRICETKGVKVIFDAIDHFPKDKFEVDFYGPIDEEYKVFFLKEINSRENANYKGYLNLQEDFEKSIDILAAYDIFLFPTFWKSEGHAGVLIDAMCAGLGIIATDWNSNHEFITNNGTLITPRNAHSLVDALNIYLENPELIVEHGNASLENVKDYHISNIFPQYLATLN